MYATTELVRKAPTTLSTNGILKTGISGFLSFARIRFNVLLTTRQAVTAARLPSDRAEAAAVSTARVTGSSSAPRKRESAHSEKRLRQLMCLERSTGTAQAK